MRATERITGEKNGGPYRNEDLRVIEIERGREANIVSSKMPADKELKGKRLNRLEASTLRGMVVLKLYGWPMPKQLKKGSQEHEWFKLIGCLFRNCEAPFKKAMTERFSVSQLGRPSVSWPAEEVAARNAGVKRIEGGKVAAKIWEPEEDPDRKNDGLHPQIGPFALRGQLEISESECPRGGTYGGGSS